MNYTKILGSIIAVVRFSIVAAGLAVETESKKAEAGKLRHIVLFKFKDGTSSEKIKEIETAYCAQQQKIPEIVDLEWGTDVSTENLSQGFTHCFIITFRNAADRTAYLRHPIHREISKSLLTPYREKVLVVDYVAPNK